MQKMDSDNPRATIQRVKRHFGIFRLLLAALFSFTILSTTGLAEPASEGGVGAPVGVYKAPKPLKPIKPANLAYAAPIKIVATPKPVIAPKPQPTSAGGCERWRPILAQYSWNVDVAVAVCNQESRGLATNDNPGDRHPSYGPLICYGSRGLFQIGCDSTGGIPYGNFFDPYVNIAKAYSMYKTRGWQPWSFTTCKIVACY